MPQHHGHFEPRGLRQPLPTSPFAAYGVFGRMFPNLRSIQFEDDALTALAGAMADTAPPPDAANDNLTIPAGYTFLGQFIDHDITFDPTSSLEQQNDPEGVYNFRTPLLELDSVYAGGPLVNPYMYDGPPDAAKFVIGQDENGVGEDLPRSQKGVALIGDGRNDENLIVSQLHLMFLKFHNALVDQLIVERNNGNFAGNVFSEAQRMMRWHYQWLVVHEFLPRILGDTQARRIFRDDDEVVVIRHFSSYLNASDEPFIPIEFAVAAYRFGHSMIRGGYAINDGFGAALFRLSDEERAALPADDSRRAAPPNSLALSDNLTADGVLEAGRNIGWARFFEMNGSTAIGQDVTADGTIQFSRRIDSKLSGPLLTALPFNGDPANAALMKNLALRNLKRGNTFALPTGQAVARRIGARRVWTNARLNAAQKVPTSGRLTDDQWPLWFYILKEAEVQGQGRSGEHLGEVGATLVGETFAALLIGDSQSYLSQAPEWKPFDAATSPFPFPVPTTAADRFTVADMLRFALGDADPRLTGVGK